ncbi:MAG TPA: enoyl-CoA hydratase [Caulobacteraceae bacterium]|nr:enoyl-CoA hydratase [Caulobacteraceae bacterium]
MTEAPLVHVRHEDRPGGRIAFVTLDDERRLNVMGRPLMAQFVDTFAALAREEALRAVVLTGAGLRAFVGGADVGEMAQIRTPDAARAFIFEVHRCCAAVRDLPVPVIGRINGWCLGAGMELAAACDLRVAAETAMFGMPEVKLGIPSVVEAALLPGLVGWGRTREMLLLGETFTADDARRFGLVETVAPAGGLDGVVENWLEKLLSSKPQAVRLQKALIRRWEDLPLKDAVAAGIEAFAAAFEGPEPVEAMAEFQAARAARKAGR